MVVLLIKIELSSLPLPIVFAEIVPISTDPELTPMPENTPRPFMTPVVPVSEVVKWIPAMVLPCMLEVVVLPVSSMPR